VEISPWHVKREVVRRAEDTTDWSYGHDPYKRPLRAHLNLGIINIDKPPGPSSHEVVAWIKRLLEVEHAGHGGTLGR